MAWNPLFSSLLTSSVLSEGPDVVAVWAILLASSDRFGESDLTAPAVASLLRISTERAAAAFEVLAAADPHSRTKEQEGRRIIKMADGGWFLPSHAKHRRLASKEAAAERQRRHRERQRVEREAALTCETPGCKATVAGVVDGRRACRAHCFDKPVSAPDPEHEAVLERPRCSKPGCQNEQLRRNGNGLCLIHQPSIEIPYPGLSPLDDMIEEMIEDSGDGGAA